MLHLFLSCILPLTRYDSSGEAFITGAGTAILWGIICLIAAAIKKLIDKFKNKDEGE